MRVTVLLASVLLASASPLAANQESELQARDSYGLGRDHRGSRKDHHCWTNQCYDILQFWNLFGYKAEQHCKKFLRATETPCARTVTATRTSITSTTTTVNVCGRVRHRDTNESDFLNKRGRSPSCTPGISHQNKLPDAVATFCDPASFEWACACLGIQPTTTTLATPTITSTTTKHSTRTHTITTCSSTTKSTTKSTIGPAETPTTTLAKTTTSSTKSRTSSSQTTSKNGATTASTSSRPTTVASTSSGTVSTSSSTMTSSPVTTRTASLSTLSTASTTTSSNSKVTGASTSTSSSATSSSTTSSTTTAGASTSSGSSSTSSTTTKASTTTTSISTTTTSMSITSTSQSTSQFTSATTTSSTTPPIISALDSNGTAVTFVQQLSTTGQAPAGGLANSQTLSGIGPNDDIGAQQACSREAALAGTSSFSVFYDNSDSSWHCVTGSTLAARRGLARRQSSSSCDTGSGLQSNPSVGQGYVYSNPGACGSSSPSGGSGSGSSSAGSMCSSSNGYSLYPNSGWSGTSVASTPEPNELGCQNWCKQMSFECVGYVFDTTADTSSQNCMIYTSLTPSGSYPGQNIGILGEGCNVQCTSSDNYAMYPGSGYNAGAQIGTTPESTEQGCQAWCDSWGSYCGGYYFDTTIPAGGQSCSIFRTIAQSGGFLSGINVGVKGGSCSISNSAGQATCVTGPEFAVYTGQGPADLNDYYGSSPEPSADACGQQCLINTHCAGGWYFDTSLSTTSQNCFIYNTPFTLGSLNPALITGITGYTCGSASQAPCSSQNGYAVYNGQGVGSSDVAYASAHEASASTCSSWCQSMGSSCAGGWYFDTSQTASWAQNCYIYNQPIMLGSLNPALITGITGYTCGSANQAPCSSQNGYAVYDGQGVASSDVAYASAHEASASTCSSWCQSMGSSCAGGWYFDFSQTASWAQNCYIYNQPITPGSLNSALIMGIPGSCSGTSTSTPQVTCSIDSGYAVSTGEAPSDTSSSYGSSSMASASDCMAWCGRMGSLCTGGFYFDTSGTCYIWQSAMPALTASTGGIIGVPGGACDSSNSGSSSPTTTTLLVPTTQTTPAVSTTAASAAGCTPSNGYDVYSGYAPATNAMWTSGYTFDSEEYCQSFCASRSATGCPGFVWAQYGNVPGFSDNCVFYQGLTPGAPDPNLDVVVLGGSCSPNLLAASSTTTAMLTTPGLPTPAGSSTTPGLISTSGTSTTSLLPPPPVSSSTYSTGTTTPIIPGVNTLLTTTVITTTMTVSTTTMTSTTTSTSSSTTPASTTPTISSSTYSTGTTTPIIPGVNTLLTTTVITTTMTVSTTMMTSTTTSATSSTTPAATTTPGCTDYSRYQLQVTGGAYPNYWLSTDRSGSNTTGNAVNLVPDQSSADIYALSATYNTLSISPSTMWFGKNSTALYLVGVYNWTPQEVQGNGSPLSCELAMDDFSFVCTFVQGSFTDTQLNTCGSPYLWIGDNGTGQCQKLFLYAKPYCD